MKVILNPSYTVLRDNALIQLQDAGVYKLEKVHTLDDSQTHKAVELELTRKMLGVPRLDVDKSDVFEVRFPCERVEQ